MSESCSTFGLRRSSHGVYYQKLWILLFLKRAVDRKYSFRLYTEMESFAGFDDIVFQYEQNGTTVYRLIQVKHTRKKHEKINVGSLLTKSSELNLVKHFTSYLKIVVSEESRNEDEEFKGEVEDFIVATNIDFDSTDSILHPVRKLRVMLSRENKGKEISVRRINTKKDDFLNIGNSARYKIIGSGGNIVQYLKQNKDFINANLDKKNGKEISDEEIDKGVKSFLDELVFAVNLPSNDELCEIVKDELGKGLNNSDKENLFGRCMEMVTNWMNEENRRPLLFKEVKAFFKKLKEEFQEKPVEFNVMKQVKNFYGRSRELGDLHCALQKNPGTQSKIIVISGAKGIGKTEFTRKYIHEHKKSYDNNIIWINAESSKNIEESFSKLADRLEISIEGKHREKKTTRDLVKEVYAFFVKRRCIFIFDNAQRYEDISKFLPSFSHSQYPYWKRPYILITSYNKKWEVIKLPKKIKVIQLNELERTEAFGLVRKALNIQYGEQNEEIDKLTRKLQHFPLALGQAVAYICNKDIELKLRGHESFTISNYLEKCNQQAEKEKLFKETRELVKELSYDSEEEKDKKNTVLYTKAVLTTLSIAIEDIIQKVCGSEALNILEIMAYFTSDDIHIKKIFVKLVADNEEKLWDAVGLLNRYHIINLKAGIANIHELVQKITRLKLKKTDREEEILRQALELINSGDLAQSSINHISSIWGYVSRHGKLIDEFYFNSVYIYQGVFYTEMSTPLHLLVENGDYEAVKAILTHIEEKHSGRFNSVINAKKNYGRTALHVAAENGELRVVKLLVSKGIDINSRDEAHGTPLMSAVYGRDLNTVEYLIGKGADVNAKSGLCNTSLHFAADSGELDIVKCLIGEGANVNAKNRDYRTPLHFAIYSGESDIVKYLVSEGADVNVKDKDGRTLLHIAAESGELEIMKCLISKGVDIDVKSRCNNTPLHVAAYSGKLSAVKYLISKGADINAKNKYDSTPLHSAAENGNIDIVEYLVKKGADVKAKNKGAFFSGTPLHMAALRGSLKMAEYLVSEGADVDAKNKYNETPLHYAARGGNLKVVEYFFAKGTCFNIKTKMGNTLLHFAVRSERLEVVEYFVKKGIDVNVKNKCNETPLHHAARSGNLDIAEYLIEKGININAKNKNGNTSLHFAVIRWRIDIVKILLKYNADVNIKNNEGMTALHYATDGNHKELVKLLLAHNTNPILEST